MNKTPAPTEHVKHPLALFPPQYADHSWQLAVYRHAEDILNRQFTVMSRTGNFGAVLTADDAFPCDGYAVFEGVPPDKTRKKIFLSSVIVT